MAGGKHQLLRCRVIDKELSSRGLAKTKRIQKILREDFDLYVSTRTIQKDIQAMINDSQLNFYAPIEYDKKKKAYFYTDPTFSLQRFGLTNEELSSLQLAVRAIKSYSNLGMFKTFGDAIKKVEDGIRIENGVELTNREVWNRVIVGPLAVSIKGYEDYIPMIVDAMDREKVIKFSYKKFTDSLPQERYCLPSWIREYKGLWYLIAEELESQKRKTFAFDRISQLEVLAENGKAMSVDIVEYYYHTVGITAHGEKPINIVLSFDPLQGKYVKTSPLHRTQEILVDSDSEFRISIRVIPSYELFSVILSFGDRVQVVEPEEIRTKVYETLSRAIKKYS